MNVVTVASVVEGYGEVHGLPVLLRRIAASRHSGLAVNVTTPHRIPRDHFRSDDRLRRALRTQAARVTEPGEGGVLVVCDADKDCAVELAKAVLATGREIDAPVQAVVAVREFEAWFLAGAESLRVHRDVRSDASYEGPAEQVRGAKEALATLMTSSYRETRHQPAFAACVDLDLVAEHSRSFRHLLEAFGRLVGDP